MLQNLGSYHLPILLIVPLFPVFVVVVDYPTPSEGWGQGSARGNWDPRKGQQPFQLNPNEVGDRTTTLRRPLVGAVLSASHLLAYASDSSVRVTRRVVAAKSTGLLNPACLCTPGILGPSSNFRGTGRRARVDPRVGNATAASRTSIRVGRSRLSSTGVRRGAPVKGATTSRGRTQTRPNACSGVTTDGFAFSFTLFSECFSTFPRGTCSLLVSGSVSSKVISGLSAQRTSPPFLNFQKAHWNDFAFFFESHCSSAEEYSSVFLSFAAVFFTSLTLNALLTIWCFGQTALFLNLLAKSALAYLPNTFSVALRPPFFSAGPVCSSFSAEAWAILQAL